MAGVPETEPDQTWLLSENVLLVESSNSYRTAPGTGAQAKDGVRGKVSAAGSSARSRKPWRPCGAFGTAGFGFAAACAGAASATAARHRGRARRTRDIDSRSFSAAGQRLPSLERGMGLADDVQRALERLADRE